MISRKANGDADGVGVEVGVRQADEERLQHVRHGRLADPAQGQAGESDAELHGSDEFVELLVELLDGAGTDAVGGDAAAAAGFPGR